MAYSPLVSSSPRRERRADPPPIPRLGAQDARSGPDSAPKPWTADRVRRGLRRRSGLAVDRVRDRWLLPVVARSATLGSLYYLLGSAAFRREHAATLRGRLAYRDQERTLGRHEYLLRRNVHMLEKGLVMRPRRPVFALEYIDATVRTYGAMRALYADEPDAVDAAQLRWAHDVLETYFAAAGPHRTVDKVRAKWDAIAPLPGTARGRSRPITERSRRPRRSTTPRSTGWRCAAAPCAGTCPHPSRATMIDQALEVAALSPSACNRQPFEFRIFDDPDAGRACRRDPEGHARVRAGLSGVRRRRRADAGLLLGARPAPHLHRWGAGVDGLRPGARDPRAVVVLHQLGRRGRAGTRDERACSGCRRTSDR